MKNTTILAGVILSVVLIGGMNTAFAQGTPEQEAELDRLWDRWLELYDQQQELIDNPPVKKSANNLAKVNQTIANIESQIAELESQIPEFVSAVSPEMELKMESVMDRLVTSEFPLHSLGSDSRTGFLNIGVDKQQATDIDEQIIAFVNDDTIPLNIWYGNNTFQFQSRNCNNTQEKCDPIIGGAPGEDRYWGQNCTVSIPAQKQFGRNIVDGIVIPKHCMPNALDREEQTFFQPNNDRSSNLVGPIHTTALSIGCDCVFIESETRNVEDNRFYRGDGRTDLPSRGTIELSEGDQVYALGSETGLTTSRITETNERKYITGQWYNVLVEIELLNYLEGDSGAPILKRASGFPYGAMNIGTGYENGGDSGPLKNYAHSWSYIQSQLNLRD